MAEIPTLQIPRDVIEPIIQAHIAAAVTTALQGRDHMLTEAISRVLQTRVDNDGKATGYTSSTSPTFMQWLMRDCITKATREALSEEVERLKPAIKAEIARQMTGKRSPLIKQLVEQLTTTLVKASTDKWRLTINVED